MQSDLHAAMDRGESALNSVLRSPQHRKKIRVLKNMMKSKCKDTKMSKLQLFTLTAILDALNKAIANGTITEAKIIKYLKQDPIRFFDVFFDLIIRSVNQTIEGQQKKGKVHS